jgi:hypothetical protein
MPEEVRWGEYFTTWDRLERSLDLYVQETYEDGTALPEGHFRVQGRRGSNRYVSLEDKTCDCPDFEWGDHRLCKHYIAVLLDTADPLMCAHLKLWLARQK